MKDIEPQDSIEISFVAAGSYFLIKAFGAFQTTKVPLYLAELTSHPDYFANASTLWDLSQAQVIDVGIQDLYAYEASNVGIERTQARSAVYVSNESEYAIVRQFFSIASKKVSFNIFLDFESAENWLVPDKR